MAPLKLLYFDIAGRAEMIRLALHIGGVDFEDVRIGREEFAAGKACESPLLTESPQFLHHLMMTRPL